MDYPFNPTVQGHWSPQPNIRNAYKDDGAADRQHARGRRRSGPTHFSWMFLDSTPKGLPRVDRPDVWFVYRTNPAISFWDTPRRGAKIARFPFVVAFAYTRDETNHFADIPAARRDRPGERAAHPAGGTKYQEQFWDHQGFALRQPAVGRAGRGARLHRHRDRAGAAHCGIIEEYNAAINRGACRRAAEANTATSRSTAFRTPRGDLGRRLQGERRAQRRRRGHGPRLVEGEHGFAHGAHSRARSGTCYPTLSARPALRAAVPGAAEARRRRTRPPPARERHALVGQGSSRSTRRCRRRKDFPACGKPASPRSAAGRPTTRSGCSPRAACNTPGAATSACR